MTGEQTVDTDAIREANRGPEAAYYRPVILALCDEIDRLRAVADPELTAAAADYRQAWEALDAAEAAADPNGRKQALAAAGVAARSLHRAARGES